MGSGMSDIIANFIYEMLNDSEGTLELQRQELARQFNVVPSQINYVLASRFKPEQGYVIESRRGGGGYLRIYRVERDGVSSIMHIVNAIGESIDYTTAAHYLKNMSDYNIIDKRTAHIISAAISEKSLCDVDKAFRNRVRASILKNVLVSVIA